MCIGGMLVRWNLKLNGSAIGVCLFTLWFYANAFRNFFSFSETHSRELVLEQFAVASSDAEQQT